MHDQQALYGDKQITVFAGDNIGASPLVDGLFYGEPTTIATNLMNVDFASVGNHEFDKGADRAAAHPERRLPGRRRLHRGAVRAGRRRHDRHVYPGADFQYLSANVVRDDNGQTLFPAYGTKRFKSDSGKKFEIGFIGEVLEATPDDRHARPASPGSTFQDEADAANRAVAELRSRGVNTNILVIHQGGFQAGTAALNGCAGNLAGSDIAEIADAARPVDQGDRLGATPTPSTAARSRRPTA